MSVDSLTLERAIDVENVRIDVENVRIDDTSDGMDGDPHPDGLEYVLTLLRESELPVDDVRSRPDAFHVAFHGSDPVGVGGVEVYGRHGLLRSVAVEREVRGEGFGTALCDALERRAADAGVETLYLLTTTAAEFFAGRGYLETERRAVPPAIQRTTEFRELCPDSATCMRKTL